MGGDANRKTDAAVRSFDGGSSEQRRRMVRKSRRRFYFVAPAGAARRPSRRGAGAGGLLEAVGAAELLAETLHAAGGVHELLLAREERVAGAQMSTLIRADVLRVVNVLPQRSAPCRSGNAGGSWLSRLFRSRRPVVRRAVASTSAGGL